jgi:hypothetical protein
LVKHFLVVKWCGHRSVFPTWAKRKPSHISGRTALLQKTSWPLYIIYLIYETQKLSYVSYCSNEETRWLEMSLLYYIIHKAIVRHNWETINYELIIDCQDHRWSTHKCMTAHCPGLAQTLQWREKERKAKTNIQTIQTLAIMNQACDFNKSQYNGR